MIGVGSRAVPHRLNSQERKEWDLAKRRRYLLLRGTGWRKERGDSPLANIYRNYCDAIDIPCISVRRGVQEGSLLYDETIIDFSPLRTEITSTFVESCLFEINKFTSSIISIEDNSDITKFGWQDPVDILEKEVIWRIPFYGISIKFNDRKQSKLLAETIARQFAHGEVFIESKIDLEEDQ